MGRLQDKRLFLLDMDGTIYLDDRLFDGVTAFLSRIREKGGRYLFLTNNSSKGVEGYIEKLNGMGIATGRELACGLLLKYGFGMKAWDYSRQFMNLDGLVCLKFSLYWGLIAFFICRLAPHLRPALLRLRRHRYQVVCVWMSVLLVINFTLTAVALTRWSGRHYGVAPGSAFTAMIDRRANDQWMENRFVEWRFLEPAVTREEQ